MSTPVPELGPSPESLWRDFRDRTGEILEDLREVRAQATLADTATDRAAAVRAAALEAKLVEARVRVAQSLGMVRRPAVAHLHIISPELKGPERQRAVVSRAKDINARILALSGDAPLVAASDIYRDEIEADLDPAHDLESELTP